MPPARALSSARLLVLGGLVAAGSACSIEFTGAEAHDQWKRNYTLTQPGTLEIHDPNGKIQVETADGNAVEVVADRTIGASTEEAAKDALAHLEFEEKVTANRISIDTGGFQSMLIGKTKKIEFHVKVPKWAGLTVGMSNGDVQVSGLGGPLRVNATNGRIRATGLENGAVVTTTNGIADLQFNKLSDADVTCETTNGEISVSVPSDTKARVSAKVTNGSIKHSGLDLTIAEESRRRLDASIGSGGGPTISMSATNGRIVLEGRK